MDWMKTAYNIIAKTFFFFVAGRFRLIQALEVKYPKECVGVLLNTGACSIQVPFNIDFNAISNDILYIKIGVLFYIHWTPGGGGGGGGLGQEPPNIKNTELCCGICPSGRRQQVWQ